MKRQNHLNGKKQGTFIVRVDDCQRGSWQGKVIWADEETKEHFRSALELLQLIDEAMNAARVTKKERGTA